MASSCNKLCYATLCYAISCCCAVCTAVRCATPCFAMLCCACRVVHGRHGTTEDSIAWHIMVPPCYAMPCHSVPHYAIHNYLEVQEIIYIYMYVPCCSGGRRGTSLVKTCIYLIAGLKLKAMYLSRLTGHVISVR